MRISELVAQAIIEMLDQQGGIAEIQRNELASRLGCVPSQINYVLSSRFKTEQGFIVESRRGGGGYIRIARIESSPGPLLMHVLGSVGESIDYPSARVIILNQMHQQALDETEAKLILAALSDRSLRAAPVEVRDTIRGAMLKNMLLTIENN